MLDLFPGLKLLFPQCLLGCLCLKSKLLFWCGNILIFLSKARLPQEGRAYVEVNPSMSTVSPAIDLGDSVHPDVLENQRLCIQSPQLGMILRIFKHVQ